MFDSMWPSYVYLCIFLLVQRYFIWLIIYAVTNFYFWMEYFSFKVNRSMYIHILCTSIIFILILKWPTVIGTSWWSNLHRCWPQQEAGQAACCRGHADPAWLQQTLSPACQTCHQVGQQPGGQYYLSGTLSLNGDYCTIIRIYEGSFFVDFSGGSQSSSLTNLPPLWIMKHRINLIK